MARRDIVVVGASAGGVEALGLLVGELPADLPAAVFVVLHVAPDHKSVLPRILSAAGPLPAKHARDGEPIIPGRIYVARPDHHLTLQDGQVRVVKGPRENGHRPAIDALFRAAAHVYGPRAIGVILSGALDDGTAGLIAIKRQGGLAMVQDPDDALVEQMPRSALENVQVDHVLPVREIGRLIPSLVTQSVSGPSPERPALLSAEAAMDLRGSTDASVKIGEPSALACPSCGGVLNEVHDGHLVRYRCQVGHGFAPESLYSEKKLAQESALWAALRALEEQASLGRRLGVRARELRQIKSAARYEDRAAAAEEQAKLVRQVLLLGSAPKD